MKPSNYPSVYNEQVELFFLLESLLEAAASRIPQFKRVESGSDLAYAGKTKVWEHQRKFDGRPSIIILGALARATTISGAKLEAFPLFRDLDTMVMDISKPKERKPVDHLLATIKTFEHDVTGGYKTGIKELIKTGRAESFLQATRGLETLSLDFYIPHQLRFNKIFGNSTWPCLKHLALRSLGVSFSSLSLDLPSTS